MASNGRIELENRSREVWIFEHPTRGRILLGDEKDRAVQGERDPRYQPDPVVRLTKADYDALPPTDRRTIDALVRDGKVDRREIPA